MNNIIKISAIIVIVLLLLTSIYIGFNIKEESEDEVVDDQAPIIDSVTGDLSVTQGKIATISASFSDDENVTKATIYYKSASEDSWKNKSILEGTADILIPENAQENWYYYITVDDEKGNGPVGNPSADGSLFYTITVKEQVVDLEHIVFIEEATATWCKNCPEVAEGLHEEFDPENSDFYYVSMVEDKSSLASTRLTDNYNILGYPTVYIDGGYEVLVGGDDFDSYFNEHLTKAKSREVPNLLVNINSEWNESRRELKNIVSVKNYDSTKYEGRLKVYVTEILSPWADWNGDPYNYAFIDYAINQEIEIEGGQNKTFTEIWDADKFSNTYKENLWTIAVVFSSEGNDAYSDPANNANKFTAYYADAADAARVTEGKLPPSIGINTPKEYAHYLWGREKENKLLSATYIIGKLPILVNVQADSGVEKVEYEINGPFVNIKEEVTQEPYSFTWKKISIGKYTITATVYDQEGRTNSDSIEVYAFMLGLF